MGARRLRVGWRAWRANIVVTFLALLTFAVFPSATATPGVAVSGTISPGTDPGVVVRVADGKVFFHHMDAHSFSGSFEGTATEDGTYIVDPTTGTGVYFGLQFFTGSLNGVSGTATFRVVGTVDGLSVGGEWTILEGTGGFAVIHGEGRWSFADLSPGTYSGQVHFD